MEDWSEEAINSFDAINLWLHSKNPARHGRLDARRQILNGDAHDKDELARLIDDVQKGRNRDE